MSGERKRPQWISYDAVCKLSADIEKRLFGESLRGVLHADVLAFRQRMALDSIGGGSNVDSVATEEAITALASKKINFYYSDPSRQIPAYTEIKTMEKELERRPDGVRVIAAKSERIYPERRGIRVRLADYQSAESVLDHVANKVRDAAVYLLLRAAPTHSSDTITMDFGQEATRILKGDFTSAAEGDMPEVIDVSFKTLVL